MHIKIRYYSYTTHCMQFEKNFIIIPIFGIFEKISNSNEQKHINIARKLF